jgi:hypothetical protein
MKKIFVTVSLLFAIALTADGQARCNRVTDSKGEVSFCLPKDWITVEYKSEVDIKAWETPILDMSPLLLSLVFITPSN